MIGRRRPPPAPGLSAALLEELDEPIVACDARGATLVVNRRARELAGAVDAVRPLLRRALHSEAPEHTTLELAGRALDAVGRPVPAAEGRRLGAIAVLRERPLDAERRLQAAVLANIAEGIALVRASDGVLIYV